ncbi:MAG: hypothetical protein ABI587_05645 [Gemmatimonadales bacterium]
MYSTAYRFIRRSTVAALILASACGKKAAPAPPEAPPAAAPAPVAFSVASIDLGKTIDASQNVAAAMTTFSPRDTIYASVRTVGTGTAATVGAKWSFVDAVGKVIPVNESSQTISPTGPVATEFHITKATAWPKGTYRVEITLNGAPAGVKDFTVQ